MRKLASVLFLLLAVTANLFAQVGPTSGGGGSVSSGSAVSGCTAYSLVYIDSGGNLACAQAARNSNVSTAGNAITQINATISGSSATSNFLNITGTFPATLSADTSALYVSVTGDNDNFQQTAVRGLLTDGPTGALYTSAGVVGLGAGTGLVNGGYFSTTSPTAHALIGESLQTSSVSAGVFGISKSSSVRDFGVIGSGGNNSATSSVGVYGEGDSDSSTGHAGGWFRLATTPVGLSSTLPTLSLKAALVADNSSIADNIFIAADNGTAVSTIADGGALTTGASASANFANTYALSPSTGLFIGYSGGAYAFDSAGSVTAASTGDTFIRRESAATVQLGTDVNGAAINQTLKAHDGITGTDKIGANLTLASGTGTGAGAGAQLNLNRSLQLATGTTQQTSQNAYTVCETKILSNTSATTTTFATIGLPSNSGGGATVFLSLTATDGTNFDSETQSANLSFVNKATVMTVSTPTITASSAANNSGSATIGFTATGASPTISLKVTPVFTTIVPGGSTGVTLYATILNHGPGAVTCQ